MPHIHIIIVIHHTTTKMNHSMLAHHNNSLMSYVLDTKQIYIASSYCTKQMRYTAGTTY